MTAWAQGRLTNYLLPSETHHFARLALALAIHEVRREVIERQDAEWIQDLLDMHHAQQAPPALADRGIALPEGVRLVPER